MSERLTREQMAERYPEQWIGIKEPKYMNDDGVTLVSAEVVYTGLDKNELLKRQLIGQEEIISWYTTEGNLSLGMVGVTWSSL